MTKTKQRIKETLKKIFVPKTIRAKIINRFVAIIILILSITLILQVFLFDKIYERNKTKVLLNSSDEIFNLYLHAVDENGVNNLYNYALEIGIDIAICKYLPDSDSVKVEFSNYGGKNDRIVLVKVRRALSKYKDFTSSDATKKLDYVVYENTLSPTMVYFKKYQKNNSIYYTYSETVYVPLDSTYNVFIKLLVITSIVTIIIAIISSYVLSKELSEPLVDLSEKAKQLSTNNNLDIEFNSKEYKEVEELSDTLNYSIGEIKKSQLLQKEIMSNITHELKTPLTMIKCYAELINDISGDDKEKRQNHLNIIIDETDRLRYLIDEIMQYSKLETGVTEYQYTRFDLVKLLKKLEEFYIEKYSNEYKFVFEYCSEEIFILADKNAIEQVIVNMLNNAMNYSLTEKVIEVTLQQYKDIARLNIKDYGIGISEEDLKYIFKKHFRSIAAKRVTVGSGIGLSICKAILDAHEFSYGVESELGKGSLFYVDFTIDEGNDNKL